MAKGYSKGRGGFVGTLVSQKFINADPASVTRGGATIQAAASEDEVVSTFTSSGTLSLACATTIIEYLIVAGGGGACGSGSQQHPGGGGGGGGGFLTKACYPVTGGDDLTITIGAGGAHQQGDSCTGRGGNSTIVGDCMTNVVATGGGYGHRLAHGGPGGSAGGGYNGSCNGNVGNTPCAPSDFGGPQGNNSAGRGGGGACLGSCGIGQAQKGAPTPVTAPEGSPAPHLYGQEGNGGKGKASPLTGTVLFAGGGGGGGYQNVPAGCTGRVGRGGQFGCVYTQPACGPGGGIGGGYHGTIASVAGVGGKGGGGGGGGGSGFLTSQPFAGTAGGAGFVKILQPAICVAASASGIFDLTDLIEARAGDTWPNE